MADEDNYDLLPHSEIIRIKKELADLKSSSEKTATKNIVNQIVHLKDSIQDLLTIFKEAEETLKLEEKEPPYLKDIIHKLDVLSDQNTRIAEGIVAVADMVKELKLKVDKPKLEKPKTMPFGQPPGQMPPPPMPQQMPPLMPPDFPPPPNFGAPPEKKKGLFGRLRK